MKKETNVRVEYECTPIRHLSVQCPECKNWFYGFDICKKRVQFEYQLYDAECQCPVCGIEFEADCNIQECNSEEVYKDVMTKKTEWVKG